MHHWPNLGQHWRSSIKLCTCPSASSGQFLVLPNRVRGILYKQSDFFCHGSKQIRLFPLWTILSYPVEASQFTSSPRSEVTDQVESIVHLRCLHHYISKVQYTVLTSRQRVVMCPRRFPAPAVAGAFRYATTRSRHRRAQEALMRIHAHSVAVPLRTEQHMRSAGLDGAVCLHNTRQEVTNICSVVCLVMHLMALMQPGFLTQCIWDLGLPTAVSSRQPCAQQVGHVPGWRGSGKCAGSGVPAINDALMQRAVGMR